MTSTAARPASSRMPPGPRGNVLMGNALGFRSDPVRSLVDGWREFGDVVRFRGPGPFFPLYLVARPEHVQHVLQGNFANYNRPPFVRAVFRSVVGNGLVTTEGDVWKRQRRLAEPAFQPSRVEPLAELMTETTAETVRDWRERNERGEPVDVLSEMMHLIVGILARTLFSADVRRDAPRIEQSVATQAEFLNHRLLSPVRLPEWTPFPSYRRFLAARRVLDEIVDRLIDEHRRSGEDSGDLLSTLLGSRDEETGESMSGEQLRDQVKTFLIAGHETTATSLTWTWYLLSQNPAVAERLQAELIEVLGDHAPTVADIPRLEYTARVLQESLRLYPPLWVSTRTALQDDEVDGFHIPAGSTVIICPYITHRHPEFWDDPETFDPERFTEARLAERPRYAYFPFSGGPRGCIGFPFANIEMKLVLPMLARYYRLQLAPGHPVVPESAISLRPRHGMLMNIETVGNGTPQ